MPPLNGRKRAGDSTTSASGSSGKRSISLRYGIFSDVHSNQEALDAVLSFFKKEGVEEYLCGGDTVGYGAEPRECIAKIRSLGTKGVGGNHDWACVGMFSAEEFNPLAKEAILWTRDVLGEQELNFLKSLRNIDTFGDITVVHGSLDSPEEFRYIVDAESASPTLNLLQTKVCFVGHSHLPMIISKDREGRVDLHRGGKAKMEKDHRYLVNVGSVGQPRDGDSRATCAIFDSDKSFVAIERVPYDIASAQKKMIRAGLPSFLAARLSEGW